MKEANYKCYLDAINYLSETKLFIEKKIHKDTRYILNQCADEIRGADYFIKEFEKLINSNWNNNFSPSDYIKITMEKLKDIYSEYTPLEEEIRKKMKWKIVN